MSKQNQRHMLLPTDPLKLAQTISRHVDRSLAQYAYRRANWLLAHYYMSGLRVFNIYDPVSGTVDARHLDKDGRPAFQSGELLTAINQVAGRLQSMDLRPQVLQQGFTLEGQRHRSVMQIIADSVYSEEEIQKVTADFAYQFACLGFAGITGDIFDHPTIGITSSLEVIHPRELYPFPAVYDDLSKQRGLLRVRYVSLDTLIDRGILTKEKVERDALKMEVWDIEAGDIAPNAEQTNFLGPAARSRNTASGPESNHRTTLVAIRELWIFGPRRTVVRYVVTSGDTVLIDQDLEGLEVYCPIGYARFMQNGTFHGAGMFDVMFHAHRELEKLSAQLYLNVHEADKYGILVMPAGQMQQNSILKNIGDGLKAYFWEPDPIAEGFNPFSIAPTNTGDVPGRTAAYAREAMSRVNPIQDLIAEKGRVDSAPGLAFLDEQITRALTTATGGVRDAWSGMYRGTISQAARSILSSKRPVPIGSLSLDLAGAVIDWEQGTLTFPENALPDMARLTFTVRALSPKSVVVRKQEAVDLWARGIEQDPVAFRLNAIREGLDFPLWLEEEKGAYEMSVLSILRLFNDGETPGQIVLTPATTRPDIFMRVLASFIAGPALSKAAPDVVNAFSMLRSTLLGYLGPTLPGNLPSPDDLAMLSQGPLSTNQPGTAGAMGGVTTATQPR
jgi:hypothetical protein